MLEFVESLRKELRKLQVDTEQLLLTGAVRDMEQYKFLMGRLEGYRFVQDAVTVLLHGNEDLD